MTERRGLDLGVEFDDDASVFGELDEDFDTEPAEDGSTLALFEGDAGGLSLEQRRALVVLLKNRFLSAGAYPAEWRVIREDPMPIKASLNDMFPICTWI